MRVATGWIAAGFVFLWNSGFVGALYALPDAGPFTLLFWRYLALAGLLLVAVAVVAVVRGRRAIDVSAAARTAVVGFRADTFRSAAVGARAAAARSAVLGVLAHGAWLGCVLLALDAGVPAGIVALVTALQPLATGALSGAVVGEKTSLRQWIGLAVGFAGVAVAVGARAALDADVPWPAYLLPFGSALAMTAASLVRRWTAVTGRPSLPPLSDLLVQCVATAAVLAAPAVLVEDLATRWTPTFLVTMAWLVVAVSLGAYGLMWQLLARSDATRVASLFYLSPPVTMLMTFVAFGSVPSVMDLVGMALAAGGVALVMVRGR